jgi:uncharacterized cupin superfamily protein
MKKIIMLVVLSLLYVTNTVLAESEIIEPILLDKATLSGLNLEPVTAAWAPPDRKLFSRLVYEGKKFDVTVMAGDTAKTQFESYAVDELVYVINGQATLTTTDGVQQTFKTGDFFMVPKGFSGEWHSQGNKYFQELIVIMKERSPLLSKGDSTPFLIDKTKLSGLGIKPFSWAANPDREVYREVLFDGSELDVAVVSGATATTNFTKPMAEEFVYILNGTATITPMGGSSKTFYTGDFFVIPEGFIGSWTTTGNHLYRELIALPGMDE